MLPILHYNQFDAIAHIDIDKINTWSINNNNNHYILYIFQKSLIISGNQNLFCNRYVKYAP